MKISILTLLASLFAVVAVAQTFPSQNQFSGLDMNYIVKYQVNVRSVTSKEGVLVQPVDKVAQTVQYFDGLGRPSQSVVTQGSPLKKDVVQPIAYDQYDRISREYLPFVPNENNGWYKPNVVDPATGNYTGTASQFYNNPFDKIADDLKPYAEKIFEPSPLSRVIKQGAPGQEWQPTSFEGTTDYANYFQSWSYNDFLSVPTGGGGSVSIEIKNNILTVVFSGGFNSSTLKTGAVKAVNSNPLLPDMALGTITDLAGIGKYNASIKNGSLYLEAIGAPAAITGFSGRFNHILKDHSQRTKYEFNGASEVIKFASFEANVNANWNYVDFLPSAVGGGGGVSLNIDKGVLTVTMSAGFSATPLKTGDIVLIPSTPAVPDMDLGLIAMGNYRLSTHNNYLHIEAVNSPVSVTGFGMTSYGSNVTYSKPIVNLSYYPANSLFVENTRDENGNETKQYTDKQGRVLLRRVAAPSGYADTYYLFDYYDNLSIVFPPEASARLTSEYFASGVDRQAFLDRWAFQYRYDARRRLIEKRVPGTEPVYLVYDRRDRVALTQDGNQRSLTTKEWSFTKYDVQNRPVLTGRYISNNDLDAMQNAVNQYYTSLASGTAWGETYIGSASNNVHGYDNKSFPQVLDETQYLTVTYYDAYDAFIAPPASAGSDGYSPQNQNLPDEITGNQNPIIGQITGLKVKNLETGTWMRTVYYYDDRYRIIQTVADHHKGIVRTSSVYDFTGRLVTTQRKYRVDNVINNTVKTIRESFTYDHAGRLLQAKHSIDGTPGVVIAKNDYNELGQLVTKKLHMIGQSAPYVSPDPAIGQPGVVYGTNIDLLTYNSAQHTQIATKRVRLLPSNFKVLRGNVFKGRIGFSEQDAQVWNNAVQEYSLQEIDYRYNIRGWLRLINDPANLISGDLFNMELRYNSPSVDGGPAQFNGNISEAVWKSVGMERQSYSYYYDNMSRLTEAKYFNAQNPLLLNGRYTEKIGDLQASPRRPGYDLNGNILNLLRNGKTAVITYGLMDDLRFDYGNNGNKLAAVSDNRSTNANEEGFKEAAGGEGPLDYQYDDNGNMTSDANKGITAIKYNHLNLPEKITKTTGEYIKYVYDASGKKLSQVVYNASNVPQKETDYIGELVYEQGALQFVTHTEGRVLPDNVPGDPWEYQYFIKDHLGNTRVVFSEKKNKNEYKATMEDNTQNNELALFKNYYSGARSPLSIFDHTDAGATYTYSQLLTGGSGSQVGLAKSFEVNPGDVFDLEVYAKYEAPGTTGNSVNALLSQLVSAFSLGAGTTPLDGTQAQAAFNNLFSAGPLITSDEWDSNAPKAYLNYILFDENFVLEDFGFDQISVAAVQPGVTPVVPHDYLSAHVKVEKKGFLYIYLSNEQQTETNVYFDDLKIIHHSAVVQINDYYPFGLMFNGYQAQNSVGNKYLFNGSSELQTDLNLGFYSTVFRTYDPAIGRFIQVDPLADFFSGINPYSFAFDNPVIFGDPDGLGPIDWLRRLFRGHVGDGRSRQAARAARRANSPGQTRGPGSRGSRNTSNFKPSPLPPSRKDTRVAKEYPDFEFDFRKHKMEEPELGAIPRIHIRKPKPPRPPKPPKLPERYEKKDPIPVPEDSDLPFDVPVGGSLKFNAYQFEADKSDIYHTPDNDKLIRDLIITLKSSSHIHLEIKGNVNAEPDNAFQKFLNDDHQNKLTSGRAKAIYDALRAAGIPASQLKASPGNIGRTGGNMSATFIITND